MKLITDWFKMINVRTRYPTINMRNEYRQPWIHNCISFKKCYETCEVINFCVWTGGHGRVRKLTKPTADAFVVSTRANVQSAQLPLTEFNFSYALPGVFADEALEKFFGQARQCSGGNFYTDAVDIKATATAETKNLHTPLKYDSTSQQPDDVA